jgi:hypothetical protein
MRQKLEGAGKAGHQAIELTGREVRRRAAAQVKLRDLAPVGQPFDDQVHLGKQVRQVRFGHFLAGGGKGMAPAEGATSFAEGQVGVDGKRGRAASIRALQGSWKSSRNSTAVGYDV